MKRKFLILLFLIFCYNINATTWYNWRYRTHDTDCTSLTDGKPRDLCYEKDDKVLYKCNTTDGTCDTPEEWELVGVNTEADLEAQLSDVSNIYTNNDGSLSDDNLSDNSINDLNDVNTSGWSTNKLLKFNASGNLIVGSDNDTTYTAEGVLLQLSGTQFSIKEGTLTDGKICKYDSTNGLVCDYTDQNTTYSAGTGLSLSGTTFSLSHLGLENLSDPNAYRLYYWNDANNTTEWLDYSNWDTDKTDDLLSADLDTEAELENQLTDVTDVYTNNDGSLTDDDLSDNTTDDLAEGTTNKYCTLTNIQSATSNDFHNIGGTDDDIPDSGDLGIIDTEAEFEAELFSVFTPSDGSLDDDDLSDNSINDLFDVDTTGVANGKVLKYNSTSRNWEAGDDNITSPAGSDGQLQYNDGGSFGGTSGLTWDDANNELTVPKGYLTTTPTGSADIKSLVNKEYVDLAVTSLGASYYMHDEDDATGYKTCYLSPSSSAETYIEKSSLADDDYIGGWISATGEAPAKLLKGVYNWYITTEKTSGTKTLRVYWKLIERKSDNSETVIATSSNSNEIDGKANYLVPLQLDDDYIPDSGSRIVGKLYADVSGGGSAPTVKVYYQGNTSSRWEIPANSEIFKTIFVPYEGAVKDVDLGSYDLTTTGVVSSEVITTNGIVSSYGLNVLFDDAGQGGNYFTINIDKFVVEGDTGNVGIGTASPTHKLDIKADASGTWPADDNIGQLVIRGSTDTTKALGIMMDTTANIGKIQAQDIGFGACNLAIQPNGGNVGIGTTSPSEKLEIDGNLKFTSEDNKIIFNNESSIKQKISFFNSDAGFYTLYDGSQHRIYLKAYSGATMFMVDDGSIYFDQLSYSPSYGGTIRGNASNGWGYIGKYYRPTDTGNWRIERLADGDEFQIWNWNNVIINSGNVGIGTTNPTYSLDTDEIGNSSGDLKIQPDVQGDVVLFGGAQVGDDEDGKSLKGKRVANEATDYWSLYIDSYRNTRLTCTEDLILSPVSGGILYLDRGADSSGVYIFEQAGAGENRVVKQFGYITAASDEKYIQWQLSDTDDWYHLTRQDSYVQGFKVEMPVEIYVDNATFRLRDDQSKNPKIDLIRGDSDFGSDIYTDWRLLNHAGTLYLLNGGTAAYGDNVFALTPGGYVGIKTGPNYTLEVNGLKGSSPTTLTISDDGTGGSLPSATLTPSTSFCKIDCQDPDGCNVTVSESGAADGAELTIVNISTNTVNISDSAGVTELAGNFAMGQWDSIKLIYVSDRWGEVSRSNN